MSELTFKARNLLESGDVTPDTFDESGGLIDLGRSYTPPTKDETKESEPVSVSRGLSRQARERLPEKMAAQLMDYYIGPEALNNQHDVNPIRDGLPTCAKHPFDRARGMYGCIHSCGANDPNVVRPVEKDITIFDVFKWVTAVISKSVTDTELQKGWRRPTDLTTTR